MGVKTEERFEKEINSIFHIEFVDDKEGNTEKERREIEIVLEQLKYYRIVVLKMDLYPWEDLRRTELLIQENSFSEKAEKIKKHLDEIQRIKVVIRVDKDNLRLINEEICEIRLSLALHWFSILKIRENTQCFIDRFIKAFTELSILLEEGVVTLEQVGISQEDISRIKEVAYSKKREYSFLKERKRKIEEEEEKRGGATS